MAPEGRKILGIFSFVTGISVLIGVVFSNLYFLIIGAISVVLQIFCIIFFRDPKRKIPEGKNIIVAPADGKITAIKQINDPEIGGNAHLISIFLNIFNVHVNRVPISGKVINVNHKNGDFISAYNHTAADVNEQTIIVFSTAVGVLKVKQIAGLIAQRILCYARAGLTMKQGDRLGFILFGSRTDIILPPSVSVLVSKRQRVFGSETIIGKF